LQGKKNSNNKKWIRFDWKKKDEMVKKKISKTILNKKIIIKIIRTKSNR
jgi:hypothetical protein